MKQLSKDKFLEAIAKTDEIIKLYQRTGELYTELRLGLLQRHPQYRHLVEPKETKRRVRAKSTPVAPNQAKT